MVEGGLPGIGSAVGGGAGSEKAAVAAVAGDPTAREHVLGEPLRRVGAW